MSFYFINLICGDLVLFIRVSNDCFLLNGNVYEHKRYYFVTADTLFFLMFIVCVKINLLEQSNNPIFTLEWKTGDKRPHPTTIDQYAFVLTLHFFHFHVKV